MPRIEISHDKCTRDGVCVQSCPLGVIATDADGFPVDGPAIRLCIGCGHCVAICPHAALSLGVMKPESLAPVGPLPTQEATAGLLRSRRSIRVYQPDPVPRELVANLLDITRWAPSATNGQPLSWIVVDSPEELKRLGAITVEGLRSSPYFAHMVAEWDNGNDRILRSAPCVALAHAPLTAFEPMVDCAIAMTYLELAAHANGLGTCWAGVLMVGAANNPEIRSFLGVPEDHKLCGAMMIGYPAHEYHRLPTRRPLRVTWR